MPFLSTNHYNIARPRATHQVPATCVEVDCPNYLHGWRVPLAVMTDRLFADLKEGGWKYTITRLGDNEGYIEFAAGQHCFTSHVRMLEREPIWSRNSYRHSGVDSWHDDFATNQDKLNTLIERG